MDLREIIAELDTLNLDDAPSKAKDLILSATAALIKANRVWEQSAEADEPDFGRE